MVGSVELNSPCKYRHHLPWVLNRFTNYIMPGFIYECYVQNILSHELISYAPSNSFPHEWFLAIFTQKWKNSEILHESLAPTLFHRGGALDLAISLTYLLTYSWTHWEICSGYLNQLVWLPNGTRCLPNGPKWFPNGP